MRIEVTYGLQGILTNELVSGIIQNAIVPRFRTNDFSGGIERGVDGIISVLSVEPPPLVSTASCGLSQTPAPSSDSNNSIKSAQAQTAPAAVAKPVPEWYARGVAAALLDPTPGVLVAGLGAVAYLEDNDLYGNGLGAIAKTAQLAEMQSRIVRKLLDALEKDNKNRVRATTALGTLSPSDPEQLRAVVSAFARLAEVKDLEVLSSVATALGALKPTDQESFRTVTETLIKLATFQDPHTTVQQSVAAALGALSPTNLEQRKLVAETLVKLATGTWGGSSDLEKSAAIALGRIDPGDAEHRIAVLKTLAALATSHETAVPESAIDSLRMLNQTDPERRKNAVETLVKMATSDVSKDRRSAAVGLGALDWGDLEQRTTVLETLLILAADGDASVRQFAVTSLVTMNASEPQERQTVVQTLLKLAAEDKDPEVLGSVAAGLGKLNSSGSEQSQTVVDTLLKLAVNDAGNVRHSAAASLGMVNLNDPQRRRTVIEALIKLTSDHEGGVSEAAASSLAALGASNPNDPKLCKTIIKTLLDLAGRGGTLNIRLAAAVALGKINPKYPTERRVLIKTLIDLDNEANGSDQNPDFHKSIMGIFRDLKTGTTAQSKLLIDSLVELTGAQDEGVRQSAATALGAINPEDHEQQKVVVQTLTKLTGDSYSNVQQSVAVVALAGLNLADPEQSKIVVETLSKLAGTEDRKVQQTVAESFGALNLPDPEQHKTQFQTLVNLTTVKDGAVKISAAIAMAKLKLTEPEDRKKAVEIMVRLAADDDSEVRGGAAAALSKLKTNDMEERNLIIDTLVKLAAENDAQDTAGRALFANGPLDTDQLINVLVQIDQGRAQDRAYWRALAWILNGELPMPDDKSMPNDGSILMTFVGYPAVERLPTNPKSAARILRVFSRYWKALQASDGLQREIAQRSIDIVGNSCPAAARSGASVPAKAAELVASEWHQTLRWVRSLVGGRDGLRCWQDEDRNVVQLREDFNRADGLGAEARALDESIAADTATPILGKGVLAALGWGLIWTAFLVIFPYSARARAIYLYDAKMRSWLSLWFLPAIMTLLPFLRRRMLRPFRDELLADAHLELLKEGEYYSGLRVRNREGTVELINAAIPEIRGRLLLIGESGLGKSTFLRVLASRSRRTIVFLNARSCDKGVESAILEKVSGFESLEFFKGLVYTGDLTVIIDGLNEVNAEVRAGIVAFANNSGHANLMLATQPIEGLGGDRSPLNRATPYELFPLAREDIAKFLKSRPARDNPNSIVRAEEYDRAVDRLLAKVLDRVPANEVEREEENVLQERSAAELILSNPMDLTYGSELIALGQTPEPSQLIGQAFHLACEKYRDIYARDFPTLNFARKVVTIRIEDRNWLKTDEFGNEQGVLAQFRLIIPRPMNETADKQVIVMRFRHDKVMDVLTKRAFEVDDKLQIEFIDDTRFRGVYLLFAQGADREFARRIRDRLVSRAAKTGDNGLSNEFVRLFDRGPVKTEEIGA
jgi:HEAT repeat protein